VQLRVSAEARNTAVRAADGMQVRSSVPLRERVPRIVVRKRGSVGAAALDARSAQDSLLEEMCDVDLR
jgi:hypothetical protein